ncbi:MAG: phosphoenolpyruvate synthase, partial [Lysobacterales bacterium]
MSDYIRWLNELGMDDLEQVGGKNASLGEMIRHLSEAGVSVPGGFATTASAFREFTEQSGLAKRISDRLNGLDVDNVGELTKAGVEIRGWVMDTPFTPALQQAVEQAFETMTEQAGGELSVAVRSSATAEDLPDASFAGQQETFLNVSGIEQVLERMHEVFASLYNDRAISYRVHQGFDHDVVYLSAGVQQMVRSDVGSSGVMFSLDTESGFRDVVFVTAAYGLGETVVQGSVNPDEFYVHKPTLEQGNKAVLRRSLGSKAIQMVHSDGVGDASGVQTLDVPEEKRQAFSLNDDEVMELAKQAVTIEKHYGRPMDIEWAKDGVTNRLYIVQARPETVKSRANANVIERYRLKQEGPVITEGRSIGQRIGSGVARVIDDISQMDKVAAGEVLVTDMTDPGWEPIMKRASAIVTNRGGRTCHAAIIARELGIPAVVGCGDATAAVADGREVTVSCAEGDTGFIFEGLLDFDINRADMQEMPDIPLKVMMNVGNPDRAFDFAQIPNAGVGLARLEFIINRMIGIHPKALLEYPQQDAEVKAQIDRRIAGYGGPVEFYVSKLAEGIATLGGAFYPNPVIVRLSDFKSNEYANLIGGSRYEPDEENPMIGFRGASRYVDPDFTECFELECRALKRVREEQGLTNIWAMVPFVRTVSEA